jgi:predicted RecB family endonuclease
MSGTTAEELMRHAAVDVSLGSDRETDQFLSGITQLTAREATIEELRTRSLDTVIAALAAFFSLAQLAASMYQVKLMNEAAAKASEQERIIAELEKKLEEMKEAASLPKSTRRSIIGALARRLGLK